MMQKRNGFTIVELITVTVMIGLLAAIAIMRVGRIKERAVLASMRSDLRHVALIQESYYYDHAVYAADTTALKTRGLQVTRGVSLTVNEATVSGWAATADHPDTPQRCYVFVPGAAPVGLATTPGGIECG